MADYASLIRPTGYILTELPSRPDSAGLLNRADFSFILPLGEKDDRQTLTRLFPDIALFHPDILRDDWIIVRHVFGGVG